VAAAVAEARALLAVPGVAGVNLSGLGSGRGEDAAAEVKAAVAAEVRAVAAEVEAAAEVGAALAAEVRSGETGR
jgi:hypothetical protein